jgi:hypothetical protein
VLCRGAICRLERRLPPIQPARRRLGGALELRAPVGLDCSLELGSILRRRLRRQRRKLAPLPCGNPLGDLVRPLELARFVEHRLALRFPRGDLLALPLTDFGDLSPRFDPGDRRPLMYPGLALVNPLLRQTPMINPRTARRPSCAA